MVEQIRTAGSLRSGEPSGRRRLARALAGVALTVASLALSTLDAAAQTYGDPQQIRRGERPPPKGTTAPPAGKTNAAKPGAGKPGTVAVAPGKTRVAVPPGNGPGDRVRPPRRGGGGGIGVGVIGIGLGLLGAAAAAQAASESSTEQQPPAETPPRVRNPRPERGGPTATPTPTTPKDGGESKPARRRPARETAERAANPDVRVPPAGETRFVAGEVLIGLRGGAEIAPLARRLGLEVLGSERLELTDTTLLRLKARDGRSTARILEGLRRERTVAFAQPNWVYTLQQQAPAEAPQPPSGAAETPTPAASADAPRPVVAAAPAGEAVAPASPSAPGAVPAIPAPAAPSPMPIPRAVAAPTGEAALAPASTAALAAPAPLPGQYAAAKLRLGEAQRLARGAGVSVAVIDTGIDVDHPELAGAIAARFDALDGVDPTPGAHGTAMAGAIAARLRLSGAAPAARLLAARAFGPPAANGVAQGSTFHVVKCLDWAVTSGARVVSMSFAGPSNALLSREIAAARGRGVIAVAAAGNAGPQSPPLFPAADPGVIAVTASDAEDHVLPVANRGAHVLVTAPGVDVLVAAPKGGYDLTSGTSVAAAEVAGVVALIVERRPQANEADVRRILETTAIDLGAPGRDPIYGAGLVDADAAVAAARPVH